MRLRYHGTPPSLDGGSEVRLRGYGTLVIYTLCDPLVGICTSIYLYIYRSHKDLTIHYPVWPRGRRLHFQVRYGQLVYNS